MIFVTVGMQLPFDRLISVVDQWAIDRDQRTIVSQIGDAEFLPRQLEWSRFLTLAQFHHHMMEAETIISHAGIGTILTALELGKPVLVLPRRASLGEHRSNHQVATAQRLSELGLVEAAMHEEDLIRQLDHLPHRRRRQRPISAHASPELVKRIREYVEAEVLRRARRPSWVPPWLWRGNRW